MLMRPSDVTPEMIDSICAQVRLALSKGLVWGINSMSLCIMTKDIPEDVEKKGRLGEIHNAEHLNSLLKDVNSSITCDCHLILSEHLDMLEKHLLDHFNYMKDTTSTINLATQIVEESEKDSNEES